MSRVRGPVVECRGLTKRYGDVRAVDGVSFALRPGEVVSILGPSGCGKTTMLRLIAGFEVPDDGEVSLQGETVSSRRLHVPPDRRNVGMVFQEYALFPHKSVAGNVSFGLNRLDPGERDRRTAEVMAIARLGGLEGRYPHELSGGQQQRVALARAIAPRPVIVLLDEPFSNLDATMRQEMRREVQTILGESGTAAVFVTHDREEAFATADRVGVMRDGRLEQLDAPDVVYHAPATPFVAEMAGVTGFIPGEVQGGLAVTEIGKFPFRNGNGSLRDGSQVKLLVRLDDLRVVPQEEGLSTVSAREFRGDETILDVRMPSGGTLKCRQGSYSSVAPGTRVALVPEGGEPFVAFHESSG